MSEIQVVLCCTVWQTCWKSSTECILSLLSSKLAGSFGDDSGPMGLRVLGIYSRVYLKWNMFFLVRGKDKCFQSGFPEINTLTIWKKKSLNTEYDDWIHQFVTCLVVGSFYTLYRFLCKINYKTTDLGYTQVYTFVPSHLKQCEMVGWGEEIFNELKQEMGGSCVKQWWLGIENPSVSSNMTGKFRSKWRFEQENHGTKLF